jgi:hypothetical protein
MLGLGNSINSGGYVGFEPTDIDDLVMWFSYEEGVTLDGSAVDSWAAKVGSFCAKNPVGGSNRPTFNTTHITFDGNDDLDIFATDCTTSSSLTLTTSDGGYTVIAIYTDDDWNGAQQAIFGKLGDSQDFLRHDATNNKFEFKVNNNGGGGQKVIDLDSPAALTDSQYYSIMFTHATDGTITLYVDNTAQADTESLAATNNLTISAIAQRGGADRLSGHVKHILAYDRELTSAERSQIQTWANTYI